MGDASWALRFEGVTKTYRERTGGSTYRSVRAELAAGRRGRDEAAVRGAAGTAGQGGTAARTAAPGVRRALDDVSFEVAAGEAFAVLGPNGAGKSTALRIAARVTAPTTGAVRVRGRVGALIEVGAGVHPELTGRENIWLYGAILGMSRREIAARFDDIVAFAELEASVDTVVKHYSSGMQLRLGFAIAAGGDPDVLVVDEALAVGDARFQLRCLDRMAELVRGGTTLVYVSHDLASVQAACTRAALLVDGRVAYLGSAADTVDAYLAWIDAQDSGAVAQVGVSGGGSGDGHGEAHGDTSDGGAGRAGRRAVFAPGAEVVLTVPLASVGLSTDTPLAQSVTLAVGIRDGHPWNLLGTSVTLPAGWCGEAVRCRVRSLPLGAGVYQLWAAAGDTDGHWRQVGSFRVEEPSPSPRPPWLPAVAFDHSWDVGAGS